LTILDEKGRDIEHLELQKMLKHWLSQMSVCHKLKKIGQYPRDEVLKEVFDLKLDKSGTAYWVRKILLNRKVRSVIKQILIANHGADAKHIEKGLLRKAASLADLSRFSRADMVIPSPEQQAQLRGGLDSPLPSKR